MKIKIKKLEIKSFRSFKDPAEIIFPETGLMLIDGLNKDTGGSSGSGKTSIVEAIAYALGYSTNPSTELKCRYSDTPTQIDLYLESDYGEIVIRRGAKNIFEYKDLEGKKYEITGAKNIQSEIQKTIGLPIDLVEALTYRPQRSFGRFISMADSAKKEFLTNCLPELEEIEGAAEKARIDANLLETKLKDAETSLFMLKEEKKRLESIKETPPPSADIFLKNVKTEQEKHKQLVAAGQKLSQIFSSAEVELKNSEATTKDSFLKKTVSLRTDIESTISMCLKNLESQKQILNQHEKEAKEEVEQKQKLIREIENSIKEKNNKLFELKQILGQAPSVELKILKLKQKLSELEKSNCPTCLRQWDDAKKQLIDVKKEIADNEQVLNVILLRKDSVKTVEVEILDLENKKKTISVSPSQDLSNKISNARSSLSAFEVDIARAKASLENLEQTVAMDIERSLAVYKQKIVDAEKALNKAKSDIALSEQRIFSLQTQIKAIESQTVSYEERVGQTKKIRVELEKKIQDKTKEKVELENQLKIEKTIHSALGRQGYLGSIFDEILDEISFEVTNVLSLVPNVNTVSLKFISESETKTGKIKKSIVPLITKDGIEAPLRSLSGGQQASIELAVDLAVGNVISRRTGRTPGWMIIDEGFDGMDLPTKEMCMELLKNYSSERLILIIDHSTEVKESFDKSLKVILENGLSVIA